MQTTNLAVPALTTRRMAISCINDEIEMAEQIHNANMLVLGSLIANGKAQDHHKAQMLAESVAIDLMYFSLQALLGRA